MLRRHHLQLANTSLLESKKKEKKNESMKSFPIVEPSSGMQQDRCHSILTFSFLHIKNAGSIMKQQETT